MIYNPATQQIESIHTLRQQFPNTSFPSQPDSETLSIFGRVLIQPTEPPEGDVVTQGQPEYSPEEGQWYQTWESRDFTPEELEDQRQASIPPSVTPRQARLALLQAGLLDQVAGALDSLPSPDREAAQIEWEYATTIERGSAWIGQLGSALGLSEDQIDDLFIAAAEI